MTTKPLMTWAEFKTGKLPCPFIKIGCPGGFLELATDYTLGNKIMPTVIGQLQYTCQSCASHFLSKNPRSIKLDKSAIDAWERNHRDLVILHSKKSLRYRIKKMLLGSWTTS